MPLHPEKIPAKLGRNVVRLRASLNLTQAGLAEKVDIGVRHLQRIESGEKSPGLKTLVKLCIALDATWNDLLKGLK